MPSPAQPDPFVIPLWLYRLIHAFLGCPHCARWRPHPWEAEASPWRDADTTRRDW